MHQFEAPKKAPSITLFTPDNPSNSLSTGSPVPLTVQHQDKPDVVNNFHEKCSIEQHGWDVAGLVSKWSGKYDAFKALLTGENGTMKITSFGNISCEDRIDWESHLLQKWAE
jgi:hypothetical protein